MREHIAKEVNEAIESKQKLAGITDEITTMCDMITDCFKNQGKLIIFGNGGSAADAQHIAAEFVWLLNQDKKRPSMHAVALTTNTSIITAVSNDKGYEHLFSRQLESLVNSNDVAIGISTSGNSKNVVNGLLTAKEKGAKSIAWTGSVPGKICEVPLDFVLKVPSNNVNRIQEMHITIGHILCSAVEKSFHNLE